VSRFTTTGLRAFLSLVCCPRKLKSRVQDAKAKWQTALDTKTSNARRTRLQGPHSMPSEASGTSRMVYGAASTPDAGSTPAQALLPETFAGRAIRHVHSHPGLGFPFARETQLHLMRDAVWESSLEATRTAEASFPRNSHVFRARMREIMTFNYASEDLTHPSVHPAPCTSRHCYHPTAL